MSAEGIRVNGAPRSDGAGFEFTLAIPLTGGLWEHIALTEDDVRRVRDTADEALARADCGKEAHHG